MKIEFEEKPVPEKAQYPCLMKSEISATWLMINETTGIQIGNGSNIGSICTEVRSGNMKPVSGKVTFEF